MLYEIGYKTIKSQKFEIRFFEIFANSKIIWGTVGSEKRT